MAASLTFDRYVDLVATSATRMITTVEEVGFDAAVVTCPGWDGRDLIAHMAMVQRWAAANVRGDDADGLPSKTEIRATVDDLAGYFRGNLDGLLSALRAAPDDLEALVFLKDAPPPKVFWARRQAHEHTIHMVDALSTLHGRVPTAAEVGVEHGFALDGIDELVSGFMTRGKSKLFDGTEFELLIAPTDSDRRWLLHVAEKLTVTSAEHAHDHAIEMVGDADAIYLALWNRGDEIDLTGDDTLLDRWRRSQRVRWG